MPNWCEGTLKIRGPRKNIIDWLKNGLISVDIEGNKIEKNVVLGAVQEDNWKSQFVYIETKDDHYDFYIDNTSRGFITENIDMYFSDIDGIEYIALNFKQSWDINSKELSKISKKYNIDFKIYGFERGQKFNRDIEIIQGKIITDDVIHFKNYRWDCINPEIGG